MAKAANIIEPSVAALLENEAHRINNPGFIANDPVQFPRRYTKLQDIEVAALLTSTIAWGNRKMICRDAERLLELMGTSPHEFVIDKAYEELPDMNIHRTFFAKNLRHYLRGLNKIYTRFSSLNDFAVHEQIASHETPSWKLAECLNRELAEANNGETDSRCLPLNLRTTALKRLNMALRWLVRDDGIVDMGVWTAIKPSQLFIPLDVHVGNVGRSLGLIERKQNDRATAIDLTEKLRKLNPEDPTIFDFALFGIGIEGKTKDTAD